MTPNLKLNVQQLEITIMRNDRMIPGMILVVIGAMFLLFNFGYINFHWENFAILWPMFIIVPGVLLLLSIFRSPWISGLKAVIIIGAVGMLLFGNLGSSRFHWWKRAQYYNSDYDDNNDDDDSSDGAKVMNIKGNGEFKEAYKDNMKIARLNLSGGAATFRLVDTTSDLFKADAKEFKGRFDYNGHQDDSIFVMDFRMKNARMNNWGNNNDHENNNIYLSLNSRPEWEVNVNAGATDLNFDLSKYKVREVTLNGGASQFVLKMGQPLASTNIEVSTGAADVTIDIPQNAACQIESDGNFLASNNFDKNGFTKTDDSHFQTPGFSSAANKMYIHINGAISDFKVNKY
jgi:hypothetical protein